jgi:hypothetical protein
VGILLWVVCGLAALGVARVIPPGRPPTKLVEAGIALASSLILGITATALDFGGWRSVDFRAALFIVFGSFAAIGLLRAVRLASRSASAC